MYTSINRATEEALTDYLISYCDPLEMTASFYTGLGNVDDLTAPAVLTSVIQSAALVPGQNTKVADLTVQITVKEMAADTASGSLGVFPLTIYNALVDPNVVSLVKNLNSWSFSPVDIKEVEPFKESRREDSIYHEAIFRIVGALSGSA